MSTPADGLMSWGEKLRRLPQQGLDMMGKVGAPIEQGVEGLLGIHRPLEPQDTSWHDGMVRDANQGFQQAAQPLHMMSKPMKGK